MASVRERLDLGEDLDVAAVLEKRNPWTMNWRDDQVIVPFHESMKASLVRGHGELTGEKKVNIKKGFWGLGNSLCPSSGHSMHWKRTNRS